MKNRNLNPEPPVIGQYEALIGRIVSVIPFGNVEKIRNQADGKGAPWEKAGG